jgi:tetratricopeptide (TPR) repeat protein
MKKISRNTIYRYLAFVAILLTSFSCSDEFFKEDVGNRITPEENYQSVTDLNNTISGALKPFQKLMPNLILVDGLRSDMMDVTQNSDGYMIDLNEHHVLSTDNPYIDASEYYKVIISVNEILKNIDRVAEIDPNYNSYYLFFEKGSLIGVRAWAYFTLVKLYGEAALINDNMVNLPADLSQVMLNKDAMIDTLINQLKPYIHTDDSKTEYGAVINTKALLGEFYLEKNDYANAARYLKLAMESYGNNAAVYKVTSSFEKISWKKIFINANNVSNVFENIYVVPFNSMEKQINPVTSWTLYSDKFMVKPAKVVVDSYKSQKSTEFDGDLYRGKGVTYDTIPGTNDSYYISKYSIDKGEPFSTDIIVLRASDVHLLLAEALNRLGDTQKALVLLNNGFNEDIQNIPAEYTRWSSNVGIRGRVLLMPKSIPAEIIDPTAITEYIEDLIIEERAMELAYEGRRWFDLMRIANRRNNPDYLASRVAAKFSNDPAKAASIRNLLQDKSKWYLPLK